MKRLLVLLIAVVFASCSQDQVESINPVAGTSLSVLEGKLLSFKDDKSFIKEYSVISELKSTKQIQGWISKKGHSSLLNTADAAGGIEDSIISNTRIIYSDALKAIVNADSKFKIDGKVLWLNERNLYILTDKDCNKSQQDLKIIEDSFKLYGKILSFSNSGKTNKNTFTSRYIIPNENKVKTFVNNGPNDKRYILDLFNETIVLNDQIVSSNMYLRSIMQYKSCSFWRCTYKEDTSTARRLELNIEVGGGWNRSVAGNIVYLGGFQGTYSVLLATANVGVPYANPGNFTIYGNVMTVGLNGYIWNQAMSWY